MSVLQRSQSRSPAAGAGDDGVLRQAEQAVDACERLLLTAKSGVRAMIGAAGLDRSQQALHSLAWLATYAQAMRQMAAWGRRLEAAGALSELDKLLLIGALGEYAAQIAGGIPMSQGETARLADMGVHGEAARRFSEECADLIAQGTSAPLKAAIAEAIANLDPAMPPGNPGLDDTHTAIGEQMRRFCEAEVIPFAHGWHLTNSYVPLDVIAKLAELGVFGVSLPEEYGGLGLGKEAMCVVSEELSRGYIGVGSLGTRSEIAAELILSGGTGEQKRTYLPRIAAGEILPTAVFTEPDTGSDLASLKTRAVLEGDAYRITGQKTWITHAARADLMTLLARTDPHEPGYKGLSMFLVEKPRGSDDDPFPVEGMSGSEIEVLGYRGMKEFEISFDGFAVPRSQLLGGVEGQGFKQLMATFESARIQTAARAIGVAQSAFDLALGYARERKQFGKAIYAFPRVANKIVTMAIELMIARQLTYYAAREKDGGRRCDLEAGMAKLLAARVAWAAADNALQIHGGNGFALEYPISRVLCDARILNIFEGAAEIQAQVIGRRLLEGGN